MNNLRQAYLIEYQSNSQYNDPHQCVRQWYIAFAPFRE
jgi:hypothetical protein